MNWQPYDFQDESTKDLMVLFYCHLTKGEAKDKAWRNAKLDYINCVKNPAFAHLIYWSGFIGIGDMRALNL